MTTNVRELVCRVLLGVFQEGVSLAHLPAFLNKYNLSTKDRAFLQECVFGCCRFDLRLQAILEQLLDKPLAKKHLDIYILLLVSLYQIEFLRTPDHAAVSEALKVCEKWKKIWAKGLVNAVLRRYLREKIQIQHQLLHDEEAQTAHPSWLLDLIKKDWPAQSSQIILANNVRPPMFLRVNRLKITREELQKIFSKKNIDSTLSEFFPDALLLKSPTSVEGLTGFLEGLFSVQDGAAQIAASLLEVSPEHRVLDACAAPGGKLTHLFERQPKLRQVIALENQAERMQIIVNTLDRLNLKERVQLKTADCKQTKMWWDGQYFERILVDAPCSGTGVLRRHPDIKILRRTTDIEVLAVEQENILTALWPTLAIGGRLLYCTCSILTRENDAVIARFLEKFLDADVIKISDNILKETLAVTTRYGRQCLPGNVPNIDGLYYAVLTKKMV